MVTRLEQAGAEKQLVQLALGLTERDWQVDVISLMPPIAFSEQLEAAGVTVTSLALSRSTQLPQAFIRAVRYLRKTRPPILCTFNYHADLLGRVAGNLAGVPIITSSLRNEKFGGRWRDWLIRATTPLTTVTTTNSHLAANSLVARGVVPKNRMRVIPNGIVTDTYLPDPVLRQTTRKALGLSDDSFVWLSAGRLEPQKDHATLLSAFSQLDSRHHLLLAGEGSLQDALEQQARQLDLGASVHFLGLRRDIPMLLGAADGFVLSSIFEGLPNVVMEALAAGLPVVSTSVGGVRELIEEEKSGLIVPVSDPSALATAMRHVAALMPEERQRWGKHGQIHVRNAYSLPIIVGQWESLFLDLLATKA